MASLIRPLYLYFFAVFSVLPHAWDLHLGYVIASLTLLSWACVSHYWPKLQPAKYIIWFFALVAPIIVFLNFRTLLGPESSTSLLLILIGIKLFEVRSLRDLIIFLFLILLVGTYRLIFSQDLIALFIMATIFGIFIGGLLQVRSPRKLSWSEVLQIFRRKEVYLAVPIVIAFFVFFPRFTTPFGRLAEEDRSIVGFSENLNPGDLANLAISEEVAFRVNFRDGFRPKWDQLYFRGITLTDTDGFNWARAKGVNAIVRSTSVQSVDYFLSQTPRFGKVVFSLDGTAALELEGRRENLISFSDGTFRLSRDLRQGFVSAGQSGGIPQTLAGRDDSFSSLPEDFASSNPRSTALLDSLKDLKNFDLQLNQLQKFFGQSGFVYTLSTPQYENLDAFIFGERDGFCEHFASALALLLRGLGYPARLVTGFQGGEYNEFGQYLLVRDKYAHAWVEAYNDGKWVRIDPTAWVNSTRITSFAGVLSNDQNWWQMGRLQNVYYFLDGLNNRFHMFFLTYDRQQQITFLKSLGWDKASVRSLVLVLCGLLLLIAAAAFFLLRRKVHGKSKVEKLRREIERQLQKQELDWPRTLGPKELQETDGFLKRRRDFPSHFETLLNEYVRIKYQRQ